jgi:hypothetical protein
MLDPDPREWGLTQFHPRYTEVWPINCSFQKKDANSSVLFPKSSEGKLAIVSSCCNRSLAVISKSLKGSEIIIGCESEATEFCFAWTQTPSRCML